MQMNTGRITNEPDAVYFGDADMPCYGSSAIKMWLTDPQQFHDIHVAKTAQERDWGSVGAIGHAVEEMLLEGRDRRVLSAFKTVCKGTEKEREENPDMLVLAANDYDAVTTLVETAKANRIWAQIAGKGEAQVTYRHRGEKYYLQARIDYEVPTDALSDAVKDALEIRDNHKLLQIDLKTAETLLGVSAFERVAIRRYHYPVQAELYKLVTGFATDCDPSQIAFRFFAVAKDGTGARWFDLNDIMESAKQSVEQALADLKQRTLSGLWSEFSAPMRTVLVPDNYLAWRD